MFTFSVTVRMGYTDRDHLLEELRRKAMTGQREYTTRHAAQRGGERAVLRACRSELYRGMSPGLVVGVARTFGDVTERNMRLDR
jgi:hypothetical protein